MAANTTVGLGELLEEGAFDSSDPPPRFAIVVDDDPWEGTRDYLYPECPLTLVIRD